MKRFTSIRRLSALALLGATGIALPASSVSAGGSWTDITVDSTWDVTTGSICTAPTFGFADTDNYSLDLGGALLAPPVFAMQADGPATVTTNDPTTGVTTVSKSESFMGVDLTVEYRFDDGRIQTTAIVTNNTSVALEGDFGIAFGFDSGDNAYFAGDADLEGDGWVVLSDDPAVGGINYPAVAQKPGEPGSEAQFGFFNCNLDPYSTGESDQYLMGYRFPVAAGETKRVIIFTTIGEDNAAAATAAAAGFPAKVTPGVYPFEDVVCGEAPAVNWDMTDACAATLPSTGSSSTGWMVALGMVVLGVASLVRRRPVRA